MRKRATSNPLDDVEIDLAETLSLREVSDRGYGLAPRESAPAGNTADIFRQLRSNAQSKEMDELRAQNERLAAELAEVRAKQDQGAAVVALSSNAIQFTRVGAVVNGLSVDDWGMVMTQLKAIQQAFAWVVGDMLVYATAQRWGEIDGIYQQASVVLEVPIKTLQNWASVARNVQISRRRENLSLSHHVEVQGLTPEWQEYLLEQAEVRKLSVQQLRQVVTLLNSGSDVATLLDQVQAMKAKPDKWESLRQSQVSVRATVLAGFAKKKERHKWMSYAEEQAAEWARLVEQLKGQ